MSKASDFLCVFVGRCADHLHHPTGRDAEGNYLDRDLLIPLARGQHDLEHVALNGTLFGDRSDLPPNVLRLRRTAHILLRLVDHHCTETVSLPVSFIGELALMLHRIARDLEESA